MRRLNIFNEDDIEAVEQGLAILASVNFFNRFADWKSRNLINRFDSMSEADRAKEFERLAAERAVLRNLAEEAAKIIHDQNATTFRSGDSDEIPVE